MSEGIGVAKYGEYLRKAIFQSDKTESPRLVNFVRFGNWFVHVDVEAMRSVINQPLLNICYKGKYIYLVFQDSQFNSAGQPEIKVVMGQLGIKGKWFVEPYNPGATFDAKRYTNVHFRIDLSYTPNSMKPELMIFYKSDQNGRIDILLNKLEFERIVTYLAPGFVGLDQISLQEWMRRWSLIDKTRCLRDVLVDQTRLCSGLGNYCITELFYQIKCHPKVKIGHFSQENVVNLYYIVKKLFEDFLSGARQKVIYKKTTSPCGNRVFHEKMFTRPMYWVPAVQIHGSPLNQLRP